MYESYYKFKTDPFKLVPDDQFCFIHPSYAKARAYLRYGLLRQEGFIVITGEPGTGKTLLTDEFASVYRAPRSLKLSTGRETIEANDILILLAAGLGIDPFSVSESELHHLITGQLLDWVDQYGPLSVFIDEAQGLQLSALEELRLLSNLRKGKRFVLQFCLFGHPELHLNLLNPKLNALQQRITASCELKKLNQQETRQYIESRLSAVCWDDATIFSDQVYRLIYDFSDGVPRRINRICSRLLLHGCTEECTKIGIVQCLSVLQDLFKERLVTLDPETITIAYERVRDTYTLPTKDKKTSIKKIKSVSPSAVMQVADKQHYPRPEMVKEGKVKVLNAAQLQRVAPEEIDEPDVNAPNSIHFMLSGKVAGTVSVAAAVLVAISMAVINQQHKLQAPLPATGYAEQNQSMPTVASVEGDWQPQVVSNAHEDENNADWLDEHLPAANAPETQEIAALEVQDQPLDAHQSDQISVVENVQAQLANVSMHEVHTAKVSEGADVPNSGVSLYAELPIRTELEAGVDVAQEGAAQERKSLSTDSAELIAQWLGFAQQALREDKLLFPAKDSAVYYFQLILAQLPEHLAAQHGLSEVVSRYASLAQRAITAQDYPKAAQYIQRGQRVRATDPQLFALQQSLEQIAQPKSTPEAPIAVREPLQISIPAETRSIIIEPIQAESLAQETSDETSASAVAVADVLQQPEPRVEESIATVDLEKNNKLTGLFSKMGEFIRQKIPLQTNSDSAKD